MAGPARFAPPGLKERRFAVVQEPWTHPVAGLAVWVRVRDNTATMQAEKFMDEADLRDIRASLSGDGPAYARLVERYQNEIAAQMWRFSHDPGMLEELVHDVFVEAYTSLRSFRGTAPFLHWLRRIATRVGYRYWKRHKRDEAHRVTLQDWDSVVGAQDPAAEQQQASELLEHLMAQLSPSDRLVVTLLHLDELSVAQVAQRTGWSQVSVKVRAHRARKKLKALLEKMQLSTREYPI